MADETRNLDVGLRITKEGDTGAFKDAAGEVKELGNAAKEASAPVQGVGDSFEATAGKITKGIAVAQSVGAILSSAAEGAKRLGDAYGGLSEETSDVVDGVSDLGAAVSRLDVMEAAAALGRTLGAVWVDLTDASKGTAEANRELLDGMKDQVERTRSVIQIQREFVAAQEAKREALSLTAEALSRQAQAEQSAGNVSKVTADAIRDAVRAYEEMGEQVPAALAAVASQLGIGSEATERFAAKLGVSKKALDEQAATLASFATQFAESNEQLSAADFARIFGKQIQEVLDSYARLKTEAPPAIQALANSWGIVTSEAARAAEAQKAAVERIVSEITGARAKAQQPLEELGKAIQEALGQINFDGLDTAGLDRAKATLQEFIDRSRAAGQQIPQDIADQAAALGVLVGAYEVAGGGASSFAGAQTDLSGSSVELVTRVDETGKKITELRQKFDEAGSAIKRGAESASEGAEGIGEAGEAAADAASGLSEASSGAESLGGAAEAGKGGVEALKGSLAGLAEPASAAKAALDGLGAVDLSATLGGLDQLEVKLDSIKAKAAAALAALNAIDTAGQSA